MKETAGTGASAARPLPPGGRQAGPLILAAVLALAPLAGAQTAAVTPAQDPPPARRVELVEAVRGRHPRLLFGAGDIPRLRAFARGRGKAFFAKLRKYLPVSVAPENTAFQRDATEAQRQGFWRAPTVGLHWVLTGDRRSLERARGFLRLFVQTGHWELGREQDAGMASANIAVGAALLYDWLHAELEPAFRRHCRDKLLLMARRQYHRGHLNKARSTGYWQCDPQNNHRWHRDAGLSLCVLAAADPEREDDEWILARLREELDFVAEWLPGDGTSHESPSYLVFGGSHLALALQAADRCLGTAYLEREFFGRVPGFLLSCAAPGLEKAFSYGDGGGFGNYANFLFLAARAHGLAHERAGLIALEKRNPGAFWLGWLDLVWRDPAPPEGGSLEKLPTASHRPDLGLLLVRDRWSEGGTAAMFKCGPLGGHTLNRYRNENGHRYINVAHDDFDANSFTLFTGGEFVAETDRYSYRTRAANHNTILVNGQGQLVRGRKEGYKFNQPATGRTDMTRMARVTAFRQATLREEGDLVLIEGEASGSYIATKKRPALERFRRTFLWAAGRYLLVLDDLRAPEEVDFTWLIQGEEVETVDRKQGRYRLAREKAFCGFQVVADRPLTGRVAEASADDRGKPLGWQQLRLAARAARLRVATLLDPWQRGAHPRKPVPLTVELQRRGPNRATVTVRGRRIRDRWEWHAPAGRFQPTRLQGGQVGGRRLKL